MDKKIIQKVEELIDNKDLEGLKAQIEELAALNDKIIWEVTLARWVIDRIEITLETEGITSYCDVDREFLRTIRRANLVVGESLKKAMSEEANHKFAMASVSLQPCTLFEVALGDSETDLKEIIEEVNKEYFKKN
tara:strand:- start:890 stop:1294 length:405 start_codon:yes stop_codon:yes gene_type:complete